VKDPNKVWFTWLQSQQFRCRPSEILGVTEQPAAFYFDRAVFTFGSALESELEKAGQSKGKSKKTDSQIAMARQQIMARWLGTQRFADPAKRG
jgi:hypothetical protein